MSGSMEMRNSSVSQRARLNPRSCSREVSVVVAVSGSAGRIRARRARECPGSDRTRRRRDLCHLPVLPDADPLPRERQVLTSRSSPNRCLPMRMPEGPCVGRMGANRTTRSGGDVRKRRGWVRPGGTAVDVRRIPIDQVKPGTVLAKAVTSAAGLPVLAAGMELTERMIVHLERMGVAAVYVEGPPGEDREPVKTLAELDRELDQRFRKVAADPVQVLIRETVRRHVHARHGATTHAREEVSP